MWSKLLTPHGCFSKIYLMLFLCVDLVATANKKHVDYLIDGDLAVVIAVVD